MEMPQSDYIFSRLSSFNYLLENPVEISTKKLAPEKRRTMAEIAQIRAS